MPFPALGDRVALETPNQVTAAKQPPLFFPLPRLTIPPALAFFAPAFTNHKQKKMHRPQPRKAPCRIPSSSPHFFPFSVGLDPTAEARIHAFTNSHNRTHTARDLPVRQGARPPMQVLDAALQKWFASEGVKSDSLTRSREPQQSSEVPCPRTIRPFSLPPHFPVAFF